MLTGFVLHNLRLSFLCVRLCERGLFPLSTPIFSVLSSSPIRSVCLSEFVVCRKCLFSRIIVCFYLVSCQRVWRLCAIIAVTLHKPSKVTVTTNFGAVVMSWWGWCSGAHIGVRWPQRYHLPLMCGRHCVFSAFPSVWVQDPSLRWLWPFPQYWCLMCDPSLRWL